MNILIANTQEFNPQIGGVERVSTILAQEFQQLGHNVYFIACRRSAYSKEYTPVVSQIMLTDSIEYNSMKNIKEFCCLIEEHNIEIIMNQAGNIKEFSSLCFKAADIYKKAKVISVVHIDPIYKFRSLLDLSTSILHSQKNKNLVRLILLPYRILKTYLYENNLYNFIYKNSDAVVLLSDHFKKDFKTITRLNSYSKLAAISNPLPFISFHSNKDNKKENKILYIGRIDYDHKRVDRILGIWSKLASDFPSWSTDIVGDGPIKAELIEHVKVNKIERVNFVDFTNPIEYYKRSLIFCMTSTFEGLPMVLIEASYYGCIPIAFKSFSSLPDIIEDGINGYMIKPYNLIEYEKKLRLLMENKELRKTIQIESMKIPDKFSSKVIVKQWINLFEKLLEKIDY